MIHNGDLVRIINLHDWLIGRPLSKTLPKEYDRLKGLIGKVVKTHRHHNRRVYDVLLPISIDPKLTANSIWVCRPQDLEVVFSV